MLARLIERGADVGWTCEVVSLTKRGPVAGQIEQADVPVTTLGMLRPSHGPKALQALVRITRRFNPDIVQGWMYHGNLGALAAGYGAGLRQRVVWNVRQSMSGLEHEKRATRWVIRAGGHLSRFPRLILYNSYASAAQHEALGYQPNHAVVIPNGFDLNEFAPSSQARERLRRQLGLRGCDFLVGHLARFHEMKGHKTFIMAAALVAQNHPEVHFIMAGRGVPNGVADLMRSQDFSSLGSRIHFLDEIDDVQALLAGLDVFCLSSSRSEGFPNVVGEAMACAVPCVVTDVGDAARIVDGTGRIVQPLNSGTLARELNALISLGPEARARLGMSARNRIAQNYSLGSIVRDYATQYEAIKEGLGGRLSSKSRVAPCA